MTTAFDSHLSSVLDRLRAGSGATVEVVLRFGASDAWLVRHGAELLVLKAGRSDQDVADVTWEYHVLHQLSAAGFPVSVPLSSFGGQSWIRLDGRIWATSRFLPGRSLASESRPDMAAAGAFLARYHRAARSVTIAEQRPTAAELSRLREETSWSNVRAALASDDALATCMRLLDDLEVGLKEGGYDGFEHMVIHGDFTNDNIVVDGDPPRIVGVIDFGSAHCSAWPLDLATALWRSGRANDSAIGLDLDRVRRFVGGYHREQLIPPREARAIPLLIQARGLQLISRRARRLRRDQPTTGAPDVQLALTRAVWANDHRAELTAVVEAALRDGDTRRRT